MSAPLVDGTHDPALESWVPGAAAHPCFPIQNLPLGMFHTTDRSVRPGVAIGDAVLDLRACAHARLLPAEVSAAVAEDSLNSLLGLPGEIRLGLRRRLSELLSDPGQRIRLEDMLLRAGECTLHLPAKIGDYSDFYTGIHHANNVGRLFRPDAPLLPNYKFVPIGYHGRASSIRTAGVPVARPSGQTKGPADERPIFGPTRRLDYELELGIWIGPPSTLGTAINIEHAASHIAGYCLLNDWSARDLQSWEYQPLGPFLAKSFHSTVSPWVITAEAMAPFMIPQRPRPAQDPRPLEYLWSDADQQRGALSIELEVFLRTPQMQLAGTRAHRLSRTEAAEMYWTPAQLVTHHASNGCNLNPGDLLGSGTISSPDAAGVGSLLEMTRGGSQPVTLPNGESRTFLLDGDEISLAGRAHRAGRRSIGFGDCSARVAASGG